MSGTLRAYRADPFDYAEARRIADELGVSDPVAITLVRRGHRTPEQARRFLAADESHPPEAFRSMAAVVDRIRASIRAGERITVHGDFDVDGVCATALLVGALRELGADCDWLIPDRIADGYGLGAENLRRLAARGTALLVTVDCGVTAVEEVELARSLGLEVIVTDHHQPGERLPDCPILHPALDGYPFGDLCGTAVAHKLATALRRAQAQEQRPEADLDLVALATVADLVPLVGENRSLARRGLAEIRRARRPGMRALLEAGGCEPTDVDEGDLAFRLAPRINAAGRLYRADAGVELLLTDDAARAREIAAELSRANGERRDEERRVAAAAAAALRELPEPLRRAKGIVVAGEGWHPGVVGIVASRLAERHHRPTVVISLDREGRGRGSGRSIPGFDLLAALEACSEHLERFGGHRAAAGLELRAEQVDAFREAFAAHADSVLAPDDLVRTERIDAMVGGAGLGLDLAEELERLRPFGMGNPGVRLLVPSARVRDVREIGEGRHARFSLHSGSHRAVGVAFGRSSIPVDEREPVDATVRLEVNRWNGSVEPRVVLRELYPRPEGAERDEEARGAEGAAAWWERFEAELERPPEAGPPPPRSLSVPGGGTDSERSAEEEARVEVATVCAPAAVVAELVSSEGGSVLAVVADAERRASLAVAGARLADAFGLEAEPELARGHEHVVLVDPPASERLEALASLPAGGGGYLHRAWGEAEWGFARAMLDEHFARREALIPLFRALRDEGELAGPALLEALRGEAERRRSPEAAARCFRVLAELGLVEGAVSGGEGEVRVVSSEGTKLERSQAYRAYGARHQEGLRYLERRRHR